MGIRTETVDTTCIVTVDGKIDVRNMGLFRKTVMDCSKNEVKKLIFDFKDLTFIDSSGIGAISILVLKMNSKVGKIHVVNSPGDICRVIVLSGLAGMLVIHPTLDDALKSI